MRIFLYFFLFLSAVNFSLAQDAPPQGNDLDKLYTPDKNSVFNNEAGSGSQAKNKTVNEINISNAVKFNFGLLVRNTAAFFWERKIANQFTIQPGIGVCYGKDRLMQEIGGDMDMTPYVSRSGTVPFGSLLKQGNFRGVNLFASFAFRLYTGNYYYGGETFQSGYFEVNVRYSSMNVDILTTAPSSSGSSTGSNYYILGNPTVNFRTESYYFIYGYQFCTTGKTKTTHDFYCGAGFRSIKYDSFALDNSQQYSGSVGYTYISTGTRAAALIPSLVAGYVLGFGF